MRRRSLAPLFLGLGVWLVSPAQAFARAFVRFVHAVPGVGRATVEVSRDGTEKSVGAIAFGQSTAWHGMRSGRFHWAVVENGKTLAEGSATVGHGAYDLVLLQKATGVTLGVYRARAGKPGTSLIRVIHASPELGAPELRLDSKVVLDRLSYTHATPYLSVNPGVHSLAALKQGDATPLVSLDNVTLSPDVAYSAVVVGSRGQKLRIVTLTDRGAPLTRRARGAGARVTSGGNSAAGSVLVARGDSLWDIASRRLGASASSEAVEREVVRIWDLNAERIGTGDPALIFPGQRLELPS